MEKQLEAQGEPVVNDDIAVTERLIPAVPGQPGSPYKPASRKLICLSLVASLLVGAWFLVHAIHCLGGRSSLSSTTTSTMPVPTYPLQQRILNTNFVPFVSYPDRLQQSLDVDYVHKLLRAVNHDGRLGELLIPMEKAFVRIVTPAEFQILQQQGITMGQIEDIAFNNYIAYTIYRVECIAVTEVAGDTAVYLRVKSRQWDAMRDDIAALFYGLGGDRDAFQADRFHPHLTVGHSHPGVLHDDGVASDDDAQTCWANIQLVGPRF